jgi:hypothetical protein
MAGYRVVVLLYGEAFKFSIHHMRKFASAIELNPMISHAAFVESHPGRENQRLSTVHISWPHSSTGKHVAIPAGVSERAGWVAEKNADPRPEARYDWILSHGRFALPPSHVSERINQCTTRRRPLERRFVLLSGYAGAQRCMTTCRCGVVATTMTHSWRWRSTLDHSTGTGCSILTTTLNKIMRRGDSARKGRYCRSVARVYARRPLTPASSSDALGSSQTGSAVAQYAVRCCADYGSSVGNISRYSSLAYLPGVRPWFVALS